MPTPFSHFDEPGQPLCTASLHPQGRLVAWTQPYTCGERGGF